jgi:hypothetical protein
VEKIYQYKLSENEQAALAKSADAVKQTLDALKSLVIM